MGLLPPGGGNAPVSSLGPVAFTQDNSASAPRACVTIAGQVYGIKSYRISKNAHGATNTASFVLPYSGNPDWPNQLYRGDSSSAPVYVEIWAGFPANPGPTPSTSGLVRRFYGILDEYDPDNLDTTEFHCRSIASPLTTDRITTQIQNITTVQFLQQVAAQYNIPVVVDPALTNPFTLAQVYSAEFIIGLHNLIKWDVLLRSSWFDDVDVWEDDGTLYYVHPWNVQSVVPSLAKTLNLTYGTNVKSFKGNHAPQFSRNIRVIVTSYIAKTRISTTTRVQSVVGGLTGVAVSQSTKVSTATPNWGENSGTTTTYYSNGTMSYSQWSGTGGSSSGSTAPISESGLEEYHFPIPNLTSAQCQSLAMAIWRQISQHEYSGDFELAVTPELLPYLNIEARFNLAGYGMSLFNTLYWPRTLEEEFVGPSDENSDTAPGWTISSHAINHTPPLGGV